MTLLGTAALALPRLLTQNQDSELAEKKLKVDLLMQEINSMRRRVDTRYKFNNTVMPLSLGGVAALLGFSQAMNVKWIVMFIPPCALILASYSILQLTYIFWMDGYIASRARILNRLLGSNVVDYELHHAQSKRLNPFRAWPIGIIWVTWFGFYFYFLIYIFLSPELAANRHSYLWLNLLFFALHLISCFRTAKRMKGAIESEYGEHACDV